MVNKLTFGFAGFIILLVIFLNCANSLPTFVRHEVLNENYAVSWEPDFDGKNITFHVTVATSGFVGFGLSHNGGMTGADIVMGGVLANGSSYFQDYNSPAPGMPIVDDSQDWTLLSHSENATHTHLSFARIFDTCDDDDNAITEGTIHIIWSYGQDDTIAYHGVNRGSRVVNMLDPPMPDVDLTGFEKWEIYNNMTMPAQDTSYYCTIHSRPALASKQHVIGWDVWTPDLNAVKHSHHITIWLCQPPPGMTADEAFGNWTYPNYAGSECNYVDQPQVMDWCRTVVFLWAVGGRMTLFPDNIGFPINEQLGENEYVKMEIHYDNPEVLTGVQFETGITVYHTPTLRPIEAGVLLVDHQLYPSHIIPPRSEEWTTVGHCSPTCTRKGIPAEGIKLFNVFLHSHLAGRKLRLRHFRNGVELPWIANDEHYDFNFQQNRPLREEVTVLPGDQLAYECTTYTGDRNYTTLAGLSTRHEMCEAFSWYYPRTSFMACGSYYAEDEKLFGQFGVTEVDWSLSTFDPTVVKPEEHRGSLTILFALGDFGLFGTFAEGKLPPVLQIGGVFLEKDEEVHKAFRLGVDSLKSRNLLNKTTINYDIAYAQSQDFFHLYSRACSEANNQAITLFGPSNSLADKMLDSICANLGIPYISMAPRLVKSNGNGDLPQEEYTISIHPTQTQLIALLKDFANELKWKEISIIYDPVHGIIDPSSLAESLQILGPVSIHQASKDLRATLVQLRLKGARNIIIDTGVESVQSVIQATLDTGMMTKDYNYIFTMLDMKSGNWSRLSYSEAMVFGFNIINPEKFQQFQESYAPMVATVDEQQLGFKEQIKVALTLDSVELLARGLEWLEDSGTNLSPPTLTSTSCMSLTEETKKWDNGEELLDALTSVEFDGITGPINLASKTRTKLSINILKLVNHNSKIEEPTFQLVGNWTQGMSYEYEGIAIHDSSLLLNEKPAINKTLIITTIENSSCLFKTENGEYQGYCADLTTHLSKLVGFNYKFKSVADERYGKVDSITGQWDGMIGEVARGEADLAVSDLTVTLARSAVVDFTSPFMQTSIGILHKRNAKIHNNNDELNGVGILLSPFSMWVWLSIILAFFLTSICLRLVGWLSPFQKDDIILPGTEHCPSLGQDLSWVNSMWVLASTLVLRGCDIRLQACSSRTIAVVWWIFSLIIIVIYASLLSHWFNPQLTKTTHNLDNLLQNPTIEFGVIQSGSTHAFLQNSKREDLQKLWWRIQRTSSPGTFQPNLWTGIEKIKEMNGRYAFIVEEIALNQAMVKNHDCSLEFIGRIGKKSLAVATQKGSELRDKISQGIITLAENGILHQLEQKWFIPTNHGCKNADTDNSGGQMKLQFINFLGPLTLLVFGVTIALFIAVGERIFHHRRSHRGFFRTHTEPSNGKIAMNDTESDQ